MCGRRFTRPHISFPGKYELRGESIFLPLIMQIAGASILDLTALHKLEHACFEKDAWPFLDLIAVVELF